MSDKQKISAILSVVLTAIVALLAVFGYHVTIVQPQITALEAGQAELVQAGAAVPLSGEAPAFTCPAASAPAR